MVPPKALPLSSNSLRSNTKSIPYEIQEPTTLALSKMIEIEKRSMTSASVSSISTSSPNLVSTEFSHQRINTPATSFSYTEQWFLALENKLQTYTTRMDSIEELCKQLKTNTDIISKNVQQLASDFYSARSSPTDCRSPAAKSLRLSVEH
jgi:hypothetical protein